MKSIVEFPLENGDTILVEVDEPIEVDDRITLPGQIRRASQTLEAALDRIKPVANVILNKVRDTSECPHEVEIKFGIKMSAGLGAIVASGSGEVNYEVTLKWKSEEKNIHVS